jgi:hypothetical protein
MDQEASDRLVTEIAKVFISSLREQAPAWQRGFLRFEASDGHHGSKGSYQTASSVFLIDPFECGGLFDTVNDLGVQLREALAQPSKKFCLFLLSVDASFNFRMDYEWSDSSRWQISKLNGGLGIPVGVDA